MIKDILKGNSTKNTLSALAVAVFGFILLNFTFLFDFLFQSLVRSFIRFFVPIHPETDYSWYPPMLHGLFVLLIGLISWPILKSKLGTLYKAIYMTVPVAVVLVTIGIFLYRWPIIAFSTGGIFSIGILYYFYRTKQPWIYYYTVILIAITLAIMTILGVEI